MKMWTQKALENWLIYPENLPYAWFIPILLSAGIISSNASMLKLETTLLDAKLAGFLAHIFLGTE